MEVHHVVRTIIVAITDHHGSEVLQFVSVAIEVPETILGALNVRVVREPNRRKNALIQVIIDILDSQIVHIYGHIRSAVDNVQIVVISAFVGIRPLLEDVGIDFLVLNQLASGHVDS
jgi:predicted Zn-dependent protease with MMP-like domain